MLCSIDEFKSIPRMIRPGPWRFPTRTSFGGPSRIETNSGSSADGCCLRRKIEDVNCLLGGAFVNLVHRGICFDKRRLRKTVLGAFIMSDGALKASGLVVIASFGNDVDCGGFSREQTHPGR